MQNPSRNKSSQSRAIKRAVRFGLRFKRHPEELDALITALRDEKGVPESSTDELRKSFIAMREAWIDNDSLYPYDRFLVAGIGALDLILLPVIVPLGVSDTPLFLALLLLVISIVLVGTALFFGFVKSQAGITRYGRIHGTIIALALVTGAGAMACMLLHVSVLIGIVFIAVAVVAFIVCSFYLMLVQTGMRYFKMQDIKSPEEPTEDSSGDAD